MVAGTPVVGLSNCDGGRFGHRYGRVLGELQGPWVLVLPDEGRLGHGYRPVRASSNDAHVCHAVSW